MKSLPQQNVDSDIWVPDYLAPSWVCLPNNQPVLAVIQPGETALEVLSTTCKVRPPLASPPENIQMLNITCINKRIQMKTKQSNVRNRKLVLSKGKQVTAV